MPRAHQGEGKQTFHGSLPEVLISNPPRRAEVSVNPFMPLQLVCKFLIKYFLAWWDFSGGAKEAMVACARLQINRVDRGKCIKHKVIESIEL